LRCLLLRRKKKIIFLLFMMWLHGEKEKKCAEQYYSGKQQGAWRRTREDKCFYLMFFICNVCRYGRRAHNPNCSSTQNLSQQDITWFNLSTLGLNFTSDFSAMILRSTTRASWGSSSRPCCMSSRISYQFLKIKTQTWWTGFWQSRPPSFRSKIAHRTWPADEGWKQTSKKQKPCQILQRANPAKQRIL